jgi:predicted transcriptional regulator
MARKKAETLTDGEQRVMHVLWENGEATVQDVVDALAGTHPLAYTTVMTVLRVLTDKKRVAARREGRAYVYRPLISRAEAQTAVLSQVVRQFFDGSPTALAKHLLDTSDVSLDELEALQREIDENRDEKKGPRT